MALYMYQASFTSEAWAAMNKNPQNRAEQVRPAVEAAGGKLLGYYFAFGEYDIVTIIKKLFFVCMETPYSQTLV